MQDWEKGLLLSTVIVGALLLTLAGATCHRPRPTLVPVGPSSRLATEAPV